MPCHLANGVRPAHPAIKNHTKIPLVLTALIKRLGWFPEDKTVL